MPANKLSLPHERMKARLQSRKLQLRVRKAETNEQLKNVSQQLAAMRPKPKGNGAI